MFALCEKLKQRKFYLDNCSRSEHTNFCNDDKKDILNVNFHKLGTILVPYLTKKKRFSIHSFFFETERQQYPFQKINQRLHCVFLL